MPDPVELIISDFDKHGCLVPKDLARGITVVMFFAKWCGHCTTSKPIFKQFANASNGVKVAWIDWDKAQSVNVGLVKDWPFVVEGYPTFVVFKNGIANGYYGGPRTLAGFKSIAGKVK